jgi:hypothetical protein
MSDLQAIKSRQTRGPKYDFSQLIVGERAILSSASSALKLSTNAATRTIKLN